MIVHFIARDGTTSTVTAEDGARLLDVAQADGQPLEGTCEGDLACATCHVYVDDQWAERVGPPEPMEEDMLDFAFDVRPTSRLSCQIKMTDNLDGLVVRVPERQG